MFFCFLGAHCIRRIRLYGHSTIGQYHGWNRRRPILLVHHQLLDEYDLSDLSTNKTNKKALLCVSLLMRTHL